MFMVPFECRMIAHVIQVQQKLAIYSHSHDCFENVRKLQETDNLLPYIVEISDPVKS